MVTIKPTLPTASGEEWGVGDQAFDNGIVVMVKPKRSNENGQTFIATGYGIEGVVPDAIAKRIVENEMIPSFKIGNFIRDWIEQRIFLLNLLEENTLLLTTKSAVEPMVKDFHFSL